ncbi:MAG: alpha/beta fold hydrolase BchO, partial [Pseudomonadota bacterium]
MRWPNREFSEFWRVGGFVWHIQRTGVGPVMLLIHGTGAATHSWAPLVTELAETYETISVDLPGHGFTHTPRAFRPTLANVSRALEHLLAELEVRPAIIVGHSAGAAIATHLAAQRNGASDMLVLINGALRPFYGMMRVIAPSMAKLASFGGIAASLVARNATRDTRVEYLVKQVGSDPDKVDVEAYARLMRCRGHIQGALRMMAHWELSNIETTCSQLELPIAFL